MSRTPTGARRDLVVVLGTYLALGLLAGGLWWLLVDPAMFTKARAGLGMGEVELGKRFADDGWFAVIGAVLGLLSGTALVWWRARDPLLTVGLVLLGSLLAAAVTAATGALLGPPDPDSVAAGLAVGARVPMALEVSSPVVYLVWPIATMAGALLVLWSPAPAEDEAVPVGGLEASP